MYSVPATALGSPRAIARPLAKVALVEERINPWDNLAAATHSPKKQHVGVQCWLSWQLSVHLQHSGAAHSGLGQTNVTVPSRPSSPCQSPRSQGIYFHRQSGFSTEACLLVQPSMSKITSLFIVNSLLRGKCLKVILFIYLFICFFIYF